MNPYGPPPACNYETQAYLQCQNELNTFQNLLYHEKKKSDDIDSLREAALKK